MKIGIDCRTYGPKHTGIGRYVQNLVENLLLIDESNEYVLFFGEIVDENIKYLTAAGGIPSEGGKISNIKNKNKNVKIIEINIPIYSIKEQFLFGRFIEKHKLDLMHFPHFNVPFFYKGKYIVTIHDLIKHSSKGSKTTTKSPITYWLKYMAYKFVFGKAIKNAHKIITPSNFVKEEIIKHYKINPCKLAVTYEGVSESVKSATRLRQGSGGQENIKDIFEEKKIEKPYLLYVGNVYPHKNVEKLIDSVKLLNDSFEYKIKLVIVCARNVFSKRLGNYIEQSNTGSIIQIINYVSDNELAELYMHSEAFVFPTLSEGFGLPGLEAMSLGCPVICSNIPVLREIYKDCAVYFDSNNAIEMAGKIKSFLENKNLKKSIINCGKKLSLDYNWEKTARETLVVYTSTFGKDN